MSEPKEQFDLEEWLDAAYDVYWSAIHSGESAGALGAIGGVFGLAAKDIASGLKVEKDKHLWFIDGTASRSLIDKRTRKKWKSWERIIRDRARKAKRPQDGVLEAFLLEGLDAPQTTYQLEVIMVPTIGPYGHKDTLWQYDVAKIRSRFRRGLNVMTGSPIGAITTGAVAFAKGGWHPTAEDWEEAYKYGESVAIVENAFGGKVVRGSATRGVNSSPPKKPAITRPIGKRGVDNTATTRPRPQQRKLSQPARTKTRPKADPPKPARKKTSVIEAKPKQNKKLKRNRKKKDKREKITPPERPQSGRQLRRNQKRKRREAKKNAAPREITIQRRPTRDYVENERQMISSAPEHVQKVFNKYHKLSVDPTTIKEVGQLYRSTRREAGTFTASRAAVGELAEIHRLNANPNVQRIHALGVRNERGARTADFRVMYTNGQHLNVEVTTLTGSRRAQRHGMTDRSAPTDRGKPPRNKIKEPDNKAIRRAFTRKIDHGQITAQQPGVIVVRVLHQPKNGVYLKRKDIEKIAERFNENSGVHELILIGPSGREAQRIGSPSAGQNMSSKQYEPPD